MLFLCWRWQWIVLSRLSRFRKKAGDAKLRFYHSFVKGLKRVQLCDSRRLRKKPQDAQDYVTELFDMFDAHFWGWKGMEFGLPKAVLPRSLIVRAEGSQPTGPRQKNSRSTLKSPTYARCRTPTQTPAKTENRREDPNSNAKTSRRPPFWKPFQPHFREQKENVRLFFFYFCCGRSRSGSVLTVREAVEKRAKSMKPFGFTNEANHGRNKKTERNTETATTRKSLQPDLRFASTKKGETTHNGSHTKKTTQIHGDCLRHDEISPPCLRNMHKRINSLWPKQINRG